MPGKPDPERGTMCTAWEEVFGSPPPPYLSVSFMRKALDYEAQCRKLDMSRFDAAPLIAFIATEETNYGTETDRRIPC